MKKLFFAVVLLVGIQVIYSQQTLESSDYPGVKLTNDNAQIRFWGNGTEKWAIGSHGDSTNDFIFYDAENGEARVIIDENTGYIGVGTTTPSGLFTVDNGTFSTIMTGNNILFSRDNGPGYIWSNEEGGYLSFGTNGRATSDNNANLVLRSDKNSFFNGNVGIGVYGVPYPLVVKHYPYAITSNGTNYKIMSNFSNHFAYGIPENISDSGYRMGLNIATHVTDDSLLKGTLANQYGARIQYGSYNTVQSNGTIQASYGLFLNGLDSGTTVINNKYGIYQTGENFKNYFQGNVGIGTTAPQVKLDVDGKIYGKESISIGYDTGMKREAGSNLIVFGNIEEEDIYASIRGHENTEILVGDHTISFDTDGNQNTMYMVNGKVGIGTTAPDEKLTVNGKIHTQEVRVDLLAPMTAPDYVFEKYFTGTSKLNPSYEMPTLKEVEAFTKDNNHLPEIPSAKEMQENGIQLKEMNLKLLQKIEELTLYTIQQQKELEKLRAHALEQKDEIKVQKDKNMSLENRLEKIEALLGASKE